MPGPYGASLRSERRRAAASQRGAALILAMLALALMAEIAALVVSDYGATVELVAGRQDQAQSRWLARGAVDWARNVLSEDAATSAIDHPGEVWATRVAPTPVEDGEVAGEIGDATGFFNLNALVVDGRVDQAQLDAYKRLLLLLGFAESDAGNLAAALGDWIDADGITGPGGAEADGYAAQGRRYGPANAPLLDVDELRLVRGYDDEALGRLRGFVVALPRSTGLNVNFASPEVLCAYIPRLTIDQARALVASRSTMPFVSVANFLERLPRGAAPPAANRFAVSSRYFLVGVRARYGQAVTRMQVLLDRDTKWSSIVWQKIL